MLDVSVPPPTKPYRGIEPYRFVDQSVFFERDEDRVQLLQLIQVYRGTLLYGPSGVGKSSLINAGLLPLLLKKGFVPERLRVRPVREGEIVLERITLNWDAQKSYLPSLLAADREDDQVAMSLEAFAARLEGMQERESGTARDGEGWQGRPVLIFDQFEELITLFEEAPRGLSLREALQLQEGILETIGKLLRSKVLPVKLLFVFREDYLAKLAKLFANHPNLPDQAVRITPLGTGALPHVIRGPFESRPGHFGKELSDALAESMQSAIEKRGDLTLDLSEIQIACARLWESSDPDELFEAKGLPGLLRDYYVDTLKGFSELKRDAAVALLRLLVTDANTRNVMSHPDLISEVNERDGIEAGVTESALRSLETARFVRRERGSGDVPFYTITSEFLVPWIVQAKQEQRVRVVQHAFDLSVWRTQRPWGFMRDLRNGRVHPLSGDMVWIGRRSTLTPVIQMGERVDLDVQTVSRLHLIVSREGMIDIRSKYGTTVNCEFVEYGYPKALEPDDVIVVAGSVPMQLGVLHYTEADEENRRIPLPKPSPPPEGWGLLIDGSRRAVIPLTRHEHYVAMDHEGGAVVLDPGEAENGGHRDVFLQVRIPGGSLETTFVGDDGELEFWMKLSRSDEAMFATFSPGQALWPHTWHPPQEASRRGDEGDYFGPVYHFRSRAFQVVPIFERE